MKKEPIMPKNQYELCKELFKLMKKGEFSGFGEEVEGYYMIVSIKKIKLKQKAEKDIAKEIFDEIDTELGKSAQSFKERADPHEVLTRLRIKYS